ncbi:hypothetical protein OH492_25400 [Vibrio chagasii]|nr:hypothetical protein [Vibrio chagasii]
MISRGDEDGPHQRCAGHRKSRRRDAGEVTEDTSLHGRHTDDQ